jgi:hypothetical protein
MKNRKLKKFHLSVVCEFTVEATSKTAADVLVLNEPDFNGSDHCILDNVRLYTEGKDDNDLIYLSQHSPYDV